MAAFFLSAHLSSLPDLRFGMRLRFLLHLPPPHPLVGITLALSPVYAQHRLLMRRFSSPTLHLFLLPSLPSRSPYVPSAAVRAGAILLRADAQPAPGTKARAKAMLRAEVGAGRLGLPSTEAANGGFFEG